MEENRYAVKGNNESFNSQTLLMDAVLMFFTFGIYFFIWEYRVTKYMNSQTGENMSPAVQVLLSFFFPPYVAVWGYLMASRLKKLAAERNYKIFDGFEFVYAVLCLIIPMFHFIMLDYFLLKYNQTPIVEEEPIEEDEEDEEEPFGSNTEFSTVQEVFEEEEPEVIKPVEPHVGLVDELREYKELLDLGDITEEEFEKKKKELLGL